MANLQAIQFENTFPLTSNIIVSDTQGTKNILSDVQGFLNQHNINVNVLYPNNTVLLSGKGTQHSTMIVTVVGSKIFTNVYYPEGDHEDFTHDLNWRNLRRVLSTFIRNA